MTNCICGHPESEHGVKGVTGSRYRHGQVPKGCRHVQTGALHPLCECKEFRGRPSKRDNITQVLEELDHLERIVNGANNRIRKLREAITSL